MLKWFVHQYLYLNLQKVKWKLNWGEDERKLGEKLFHTLI